MSIQETIEDLDPDEIARRVAENTLPGPSNSDFIEGVGNAMKVLPRVITDLNNWFYIVDVQIHGKRKIGIPMRYRWSIIRWANNDMDSWLHDKGWVDVPHLNADTDDREVNELEARYAKKFENVEVFTNFMVEFPDSVFEAIHDEDIDRIKERKKRDKIKMEELAEFIKERRS